MRLGKVLIRFAIIAIWICLFFTFLTATHLFTTEKKKEQTLHLFSWPEILSPETIRGFEEETGIQVVRHYYTSNEELLVKLKATEGRGYDLIIPSDYAVKKLVEEELLLPLDHSKLNFLDHLNPKLTHQPFDEANTYSLPYIWEFMGFGINQEAFERAPFNPTWHEVFSPKEGPLRLSMINDPIEAIAVTSHLLYGTRETLQPHEIARIQKTLKEQKPLVEAYAGVRGDYLLITKNCSVAVIPASYVIRAAKNYDHVDFLIPKEYTFLSIENVSIPKTAENPELVYLFLNYLYRPDVFAQEAKNFNNFPATTNLTPYLSDAPPIYLKTLEALEAYDGTFYYFRELLPEEESRTLWVNIKSGS